MYKQQKQDKFFEQVTANICPSLCFFSDEEVASASKLKIIWEQKG